MKLTKTSLTTIALAALISACSSSSTPLADDPDTQAPAEPAEGPINNGIENEDPPTPTPTMLIPMVEAGSDTEQLLNGINRQLAITILDLNARLRDGISLTDQQDTCLGSYDPAMGQQLLMINCEQSLATGEVPIFVAQASYYDTPECHAAIFNGNVSDCVLQSAQLSIPIQWITPERPVDTPASVPNRPQPVAGVDISYAINSTFLRIENNETENNEPQLTGVFRCDINLLDNEATSSVSSQSCATTVAIAAGHFNTLLPE